jgi:hypothetical protein
MDETMRTIIAYAVALLGIPRFAAKILWFVPGTVLGTILAKIAHPLDKIAGGVIEGFISVLLICTLFEQMRVRLVWEVPLVLIAVNSVLEWGKDETCAAWSSMAGIIMGFFLYPVALAFLGSQLGPERLSLMKDWAQALML